MAYDKHTIKKPKYYEDNPDAENNVDLDRHFFKVHMNAAGIQYVYIPVRQVKRCIRIEMLNISTRKKSKDEDKTSRKPRKSKSHDEEKTKVCYYSTFQERKRGEPAAVYVGANAGLKNSNVCCYSNAILQCLASCIFSLIFHQVKIVQSLH